MLTFYLWLDFWSMVIAFVTVLLARMGEPSGINHDEGLRQRCASVQPRAQASHPY